MQAALTAAERGHAVILCEKTGELGGILLCEDKVPFKEKLAAYIEKQKRMIALGRRGAAQYRGYAALAEQLAPDAIVAAVGAARSSPPIPGIDRRNVFVRWIFTGQPGRPEKTSSILGGGLVAWNSEYSSPMERQQSRSSEMLPALSYGAAGYTGRSWT
jgi:pyruvate/2-oxoglutarate dehydrogenase complex dihydrolipoamide dehydrogenase (E3) component